jgi:uncharacterized pyridoxamine 5'-phosphate oxidase family protein
MTQLKPNMLCVVVHPGLEVPQDAYKTHINPRNLGKVVRLIELVGPKGYGINANGKAFYKYIENYPKWVVEGQGTEISTLAFSTAVNEVVEIKSKVGVLLAMQLAPLLDDEEVEKFDAVVVTPTPAKA